MKAVILACWAVMAIIVAVWVFTYAIDRYYRR